MPPGLKKNFGYTCGDRWNASSPNQRAVKLLMDKACSKQKWIEEDSRGRGPYCQQSCFDAVCGSADCCPSPSSPPSPPSPPPSLPSTTIPVPRPPHFVEAILEGSFFITPKPDGVSLTSVGDAGSVLKERRLEVQNYVVLEPKKILNVSAIAEDVQEVQLKGGGEPYEIVGSLEVPAWRTLNITAIGGARVKINVTGMLAKVSGTLRLSGLDIFREPFDDGCGGCEVGFPPLLDILEGGEVEIVESELRVVVGELAIAVKGALVLREATIAGSPFNKLNEFASDALPRVTAMVLRDSLGALFITGIEHGMRHYHCSFPEVFFEDRCQ